MSEERFGVQHLTCMYFTIRRPSAIATMNSVENMLASLTPVTSATVLLHLLLVGNVSSLLPVELNGDAITVIVDRDAAIDNVDLHTKSVHRRVEYSSCLLLAALTRISSKTL